jgi:type II secretory pathway pseudopilin PulG
MNKKEHFTLIELLAAIAIVIILAGILIGGIGYAGRRADEAKSYATIQKLAMALEQFKAANGYYPVCKDTSELEFYRDSDGHLMLKLATEYKFYDFKTKKVFIELEQAGGTSSDPIKMCDAWGEPLRYRCPGEHNASTYDLWSFGNDGESDSEDTKLDDITNWEKE